jgi:hypothetical protein
MRNAWGETGWSYSRFEPVFFLTLVCDRRVTLRALMLKRQDGVVAEFWAGRVNCEHRHSWQHA